LLNDGKLQLAVMLPKELGAALQVEVGACVWAADAHD